MYKLKPIHIIGYLFALLLLIVGADYISYQLSKDNHSTYAPVDRLLRAQAKLGYRPAELKLAERYEQGTKVPRDFKEAFKWYSRSAEHGNAKAQLKLGVFYESGINEKGEGVTKDIDAAYKWYHQSALQGYAPAQVQLGWLINSGLGAPQNFKEVISWTKKAADQEYAEAQSLLGWRYFYGKRVQQNMHTASMWLEKAALQGDGGAQRLLDVIQNKKTTIDSIRISANQGDAEAQYIMGWLYFEGKRMPLDYQAAENWFRKASKQNQHTSLHYMGRIFEHGLGRPKDIKEAMIWYGLAADLGNGDAQMRLFGKLQGWE